jgi:arylsulfatase
MGSLLGGWTLFVLDGRLRYVHNLASYRDYRIVADTPVRAGRHRLAFRFERSGEHRGTGSLLVDGVVAGSVDIDWFTPLRFSLTVAGLTCGRSGPLPVCDDYEAPFAFTGVLHEVVVEVDGTPYEDPDGEAQIAVQTQ